MSGFGHIETRRVSSLLLVTLSLLLVACGPLGAPGPAPTADPTATVLTWQREGGLAGFCDELAVFGDGRVVVSSCRGGESTELGQGHLRPEQQAQLQDWLVRLRPVDEEQTDPATADAMTTRLTLAGQGQAQPGEAELQALYAFAAALYLAHSGLPEGPTPTPEVFMPLPLEERVFAAARAALAQELGVDELSISRAEINEQDWPDSCLGAPAAGEGCAEVITPGYRLVLAAGGQNYEVRTNRDGTIVRLPAVE